MSTDKERETRDYDSSKMRPLTRLELMIYLAAGFFFFMSAYMTIASYDYLVDYYAKYDTTLEGKWGVCLQYIAKQCGNWYGFTVLFFIAAGFAKRLEALVFCHKKTDAAKKATAVKEHEIHKERQAVLAESKSQEDKAVTKVVKEQSKEASLIEKESEQENKTEKKTQKKTKREIEIERASTKEKVTEAESEQENKTEKKAQKKLKIESKTERASTKEKVTEKEPKKDTATETKTKKKKASEKKTEAKKETTKEAGPKKGTNKKAIK